MKKSILAALLASSALVSFNVSAVQIPADGVITTTACTLLGEQVKLNLSNNVSGAYSCTEATSTIQVAACHKAGSRNTTTVACANSGTAQDPDWNNASCQDESDTFEITDYRGFRASSQGGRVGAQALGGPCTESSVNGLVAN